MAFARVRGSGMSDCVRACVWARLRRVLDFPENGGRFAAWLKPSPDTRRKAKARAKAAAGPRSTSIAARSPLRAGFRLVPARRDSLRMTLDERGLGRFVSGREFTRAETDAIKNGASAPALLPGQIAIAIRIFGRTLRQPRLYRILRDIPLIPFEARQIIGPRL